MSLLFVLTLLGFVVLFFFPNQIHAYNLETNYWEEIVTKPHQKLGLLPVTPTVVVGTCVKI